MALAAFVAMTAAAMPQPAQSTDEVDRERARALSRLVRHDCGSCHGMTLRGGLGPALTPSALEGRSTESISWLIANGRPERAMPGWAPLLASPEIDWIARGLLDGRFLEENGR